jgi:hypothetical protein
MKSECIRDEKARNTLLPLLPMLRDPDGGERILRPSALIWSARVASFNLQRKADPQ